MPLKRLWISSVTDKAIREGFAHLKDAREYQHLYEAALSRAEADWLVGINATRALTCKYNASALLRSGPDPHPCHDCRTGGGDPQFSSPRPITVSGCRPRGSLSPGMIKKTGSPRTFSGERAEKLAAELKDGSLRILKAEDKGETPGSPPASTI